MTVKCIVGAAALWLAAYAACLLIPGVLAWAAMAAPFVAAGYAIGRAAR